MDVNWNEPPGCSRKSGFRSRLCLITLVMALCAGFAFGAKAQADADSTANLSSQEKEECTRNLKILYDAIQAYQEDNKDLPNWLSDLVPKYLSDANVLVCPACRRTGHLEASEVADPKIPSSYIYEFSPVPLAGSGTNGVVHTRREWRRRQMGLAGSVVPLIRCRHHNKTINLAFDGKIYESGSAWESVVANRINVDDLTPESIFADGTSAKVAKVAAVAPAAPGYPGRSKKAKSGEINLGRYYNLRLSENFEGKEGDDLAYMPKGLQKFGDVEYDVRGIIQLGGKSLANTNYPVSVKSLRIHQKCQRLSFLHGTRFGSAVDEGRDIGTYIVRYATNQMRLEIPIRYGREVRSLYENSDESKSGSSQAPAWTGESAAGKKEGRPVRVYSTTWTNIAPDLEIDRIDFVSKMGAPAPFLIAITAE